MVPDRHNDPLQGQQMMSLGHHSDSIGAQLQRQGHPSGSRESLIRIEPRTVLEQAPDNGATHFLRQDVSSSELHNPPNVGRTGFRFGTNTPTIGGEFPTLPRGFPGQMQMVDDNWVQLGGSMGLGTDHDNFEGYGQSSVSDTLPPLNPPIDWTHFWEGEGQTAPGPSSGEYRG
ncbi:hypothetical protein BDV96DRAFT_568485 [Lophiotrema nucula]|uniref:Uncharacterized protein n=1 Tax=Lophiotrema nucula TaxID=690887 RepID=A0A6A5ZI14_9PLEO|nr:hypothetical protein BDV96DRAFT_568485 [Lophiotrema nucula]